MLSSYLCALDIGSSKIAACVAEVRKKQIRKLFFGSAVSKYVNSGVIVDSIGLVDAIGRLLANLRSKSGINIKYLNVNISGKDIIAKHSRAVVPLAERGNKIITVSDMQRANEQARILGSSLEEEIIHQVPRGYTIDAKAGVANPLGLYSSRLEVDLYLLCAKLSSVQSLARAVSQSGYEIRELCFSGLATSKVVFNSNEFKNGTSIICDIGSDITELSVFDNGVLREVEILNIGGNLLTVRLSEELKIPFELAEGVKISHGIIADPRHIPEDKETLVRKGGVYQPIKQRLLAQIISAQAKVLCDTIAASVSKKASVYDIDAFVVTGRSVLLEGMIEALENALAVPVRMARISEPQIAALTKEDKDLSGHKYLTFLTCLGMLCEALQEKPVGILPSQQAAKSFLIKAVNRLKEVYQEYF
jgi:cell division protein FtsA